jgi:Holliday junction resolvase
MGKASREKGARGERQWRDVCREHGYDAKRGCQLYQKGSEIADVIGLPGIHCEVKNVERLNLRDAMNQSVRDAESAGKGELPIVAHKKSRLPFLVTMLADDWFQLYREWEAGRGE